MEELIKRAALALGMGVPEAEVVKRLKADSNYHSDWDIFFAIEAAKVSNKHREMIRR
jgi:hypothetical protein